MKTFRRRDMNFTPDTKEGEEMLEKEDELKKKALEGIGSIIKPSPEVQMLEEGRFKGETDAEFESRTKQKRGVSK